VSAQLEHIESRTTLAPAARAAIALDSARHRKELVDLVKKSAGIVAVLNGDARDEAHRAGMVLKTARVTIQKRGKEAREDATVFSKAVIAEEKTLVDLISPEEERVLALRDRWDAQVEAERQAKIAAERARVEALQERVAAIRNTPALMTGKSSEEISRTIGYLAGSEPGASFEEFEEQAKAARLEALDRLAKMETEQRGVEIRQESARQEAERQRLEQEEEAARLKAEREELAQLRAQQQAQLAAERAEAERIRKLEDEARAFKLQQEREELERQNATMRLERMRLAEEQAALNEAKRVAAKEKADDEERKRLAEAARAFLASAKAAPVAEWAYSFDEEQYRGSEPTIEDAIAEAIAEAASGDYGQFWVGKCKRFAGAGDANSVIERLQEQCYEECGEYGETYLEDVTAAEKQELAGLITAWAARVDRSNFFTIEKAQLFTVEQAQELIGAQPATADAQ
jgi:hypothetical protein